MSALIPLPTLRRPETETTQYFPKPGRTPSPRLQVVPNFEAERTTYARPTAPRSLTWDDILRMRGELPAAQPKRASASKAPWARKGWVYPEPMDAAEKRARSIRSAQQGLAKISHTPKSLGKLLATPEWQGATVAEPTPEEFATLNASATRALEDARQQLHAAKGKANKARAQAHVDACGARLGRLDTARRVVHPSGAVLLWNPL